MDRPILVAQATGLQGSNGNPTKVVVVNKPQGEQAIAIHLDGSTKLDLSAIANEQITLVHLGDRLIILFDNHAQITVEPFFGDNGQPLQDLTVELGPGRDVTASEFASQFPITDDPSVLPASGGPGAPSSGANFVSFTLDTLSTPSPLDLLGPEGGTNGFGTPNEAPGNTQIVPMSLTNAVINGGVDEGGMVTDTIHTVGNDPGAAFAATGVSGSLFALVNFGTGGPNGHPFQFVTTAAADTWLAHLGLESHGALIDTATVTGNTLTASTDPAQGTPHDVFTLTLNDDGSWVFTLLSPLDHVTGQGENTALLDLSGLVQAVDASGVTLTLVNDFKITVVDDVPVEISGAVASGSVDEGALNGVQSPGDLFGNGNDHGNALSFVSGTLSGLVAFGADGPATVTFGSGEGEGHETVTDGFQLAVATGAHDFGVTSHGLEVGFITVTSFGTTEILTASTGSTAGGNEVFSLLLNGDGSYSFVLINPIDHPAAGEDSTTLDLSSLIKAIDFDGDVVGLSGDFKITIIDDVPVLVSGASGSTGSVDEGALSFSSSAPGDHFGDGNDHGQPVSVSISGTLAGLVSFGADGPALSGGSKDGFQFGVATGAHDFGVQSHGAEVDFLTVTTSGTTETLTAFTGGSAGGIEVFTLVLNGDGTYTFTLINPLDDAPGNGENSVTLDLSSLIKGVDFDGDTVTLTSGDLQIAVIDDVPVQVSGTSTGFVDEGGLDQKSFHGGTDLYGDGNDPFAPTVASGTIAGLVRFGADGAESGTFTATFTDSHHHTQSLTQTVGDGFHFVDANSAEAWLTGQDITSHGEEINFVAVTSATSTNGATVSDVETLAAWTDGGPGHGGHEVFTLSLNVTTGAWTFTLLNPIDHPTDNGENSTLLDLSGLMQAIDFDGDAVTLSSGNVTITVKDDVPVLDRDDDSYGKVDEGALHHSSATGDLYGDGNDQGYHDFATSTACGSLEDLVRFGADGPAAKEFQFVSQAAAATWITSLGLKSHGDLIDTASISTDSHGNLVLIAGTDQGDGHSVFTLTLDQGNGQWVFTLLNPLDQATDNGENAKSIDLSGLIQAVDFDGDTVTLANDFSITVVDDVPELTCVNSSGSVDEGALVSSSFLGDLYGSGNDAAMSAASVTVTGGLSGLVAFGADGPNATADYRFVSQSAASHWLGNLNLSSHGSDVDNVSIVNQGGGLFLLTAKADDGHAVFTLQLDQATGAWTFTLLNPIDHVPGHGENSTTLDLSGLIQAVDFDGDAVTLSDDFTIKIVDDVPVLASGTSTGSVDEGGLSSSTHADLFGSGNDHGAVITATGTLSGLVAFGADGPDTGTSTSNHHTVTINTGYQFVSEHTAESWLASLNNGHGFKSHGETIDEVNVSVSNGIATLTAGTDHHDVFTLQLNETTGAWTFTLINPIDHPAGNSENTLTVDLSGLVQGVDFDGDAVTLSGDFAVTVTDDVPVLAGKSSTGTVDEGGLHSSSTLGDLYGSGNDHGAITATGSLAQFVSFGADGPATGGGFRLVDAATATAWLGQLQLMSHNTVDANGGVNQYVDVAIISGNTLQAWAGHPGDPGAHEVFTLTLNSNGTYTFQLVNPLDDPTPGHGNPAQAVADSVMIDLSGFVQAVDFDGDALSLASGTSPSASSDFTITVIDDIPVLVSGAVVSGSMDEGALRGTLSSGTDTWGTGNDSGTVTASGAAGSLNSLVHFGADGPAGTDFKVATHDDALSWLQKLDLTSHGAAVDQIKITVDGVGGSTLTVGTDDGHDVFALTVHPDGSWTFTLLEPIDHTGPTYSGSGPEPTTTIDLSGFVRAVDFDGDAISLASGASPSLNSDFSVTITDDVPTLAAGASASTGSVDEGALVQGSAPNGDLFGNGNDHGNATAVLSGSLSGLVSFGADGAANGGGFRLADAVTATAWLKSLDLTSHNSAIDFAVINGNTLNAWTAEGPGNTGAHKVFTLTLNSDGTYTFHLINPIDDPNPGLGTPGAATEDSVNVDLSGLVQAVDFDGDVTSLSSGTPSSASHFNVTVVDDVPVTVSGAVVSGGVDEGALTAGNDSSASFSVSGSSGSLNLNTLVHFGADGPAATDFKFVSHADAVSWVQHLGLTSHGSAVDNVTTVNGVLTAVAHDGHSVFTLTANNDGSWSFTLLAPVDHTGPAYSGSGPEPTTTIDLSGFIQAVDFDGDAVTLGGGDFKVTITDDVPLGPTLTINPSNPDNMNVPATLIEDESPGVQPSPANDVAALPAVFSGVAALPAANTAIGFAEHDGAIGVTPHYGADGAGATGTALSLTNSAGGTFFEQTTNFFDTLTGNRIFLYTDPTSGIVLGKVGDGTALNVSSADDNGAVAFAIGVDSSGNLSFVQYRALKDNPSTTNDPNDEITLQTGGANGTNAVYVTAVSTDADGDHASTTSALVIRVADDGPTTPQSATLAVDEHNLSGGDITDTAHTAALVPGTDGYLGQSLASAISWTLPTGLTLADGTAVTVSANGATVTGMAGSNVAFTLTVAADGTYTYDQKLALAEPNPGADTKAINFGFTITDGDGDASGSATITVNVTDDVPTAHHVDLAVSESAAAATATLVLSHDFSFGADGPGSIAFDTAHAVISGPNGVPLGTPGFVANGSSLEIDPGTAFQHLGAGESATVDVSYTVTDADGDTATSDVLVTVFGENQAPMFTGGSTFGETSELTLVTHSSTPDTASGVVTFSDPDTHDIQIASATYMSGSAVWSGGNASAIPTQTLTDLATAMQALVTTQAQGGTGQITWTATLPDQDLDFVAQGETLTAGYLLNVSDGKGGSNTVQVTVVFNGADDAPMITSAAQSGTVTAHPNPGVEQASGHFTFTDADINGAHSATFVAENNAQHSDGSNYVGQFSLAPISESGGNGGFDWQFSVLDSELASLGAGRELKQFYDVTVDDGLGGKTTQTVEVDIFGANHPPTTHGNAVGTLETSAYTFKVGDFPFADTDVPANTLLNVIITGLPTSGLLTDNGAPVTLSQTISVSDIANGHLVFTPAIGAGFAATSTFQFEVEDNGGTANGGSDTSPPATMTIGVTRQGPNALSFVASTGPGSALADTGDTNLAHGDTLGTFTASGDPNSNDTFTYSIQGGIATGVAIDPSTGVLSVSAAASNLNETFTVAASDGIDPAVTEQVTLWVGGAGNDASPDFSSLSSGIALAYGLGGDDTFTASTASFTPTNVFDGGSGNDTIVLTDAAGVTVTDADFTHVVSVETLQIGGAGPSVVTLGANASADVGAGGTLTVDDSAGTGNLTVDGAAMTANLTVIGGAGANNLTGGSGNDTFIYNVATGGSETVHGRAGNDTAVINGDSSPVTYNINPILIGAETDIGINIVAGTTGASAIAADPTHYEVATKDVEELVINLGNAGDKVVVSGDLSGTGLATNTITINGGAGNDTVDLSGFTSNEHVVFNGSGSDTVILGFASTGATYQPIFDTSGHLIGTSVTYQTADGPVTDVFNNVANYQFTDTTLTLGQIFPPSVTAPSQAVADTAATEAGHVLATGNALAGDTDIDVGSTLAVSVVEGQAIGTNTVVHGTYGDLTISADGTYSYTATAALDALPAGAHPSDVFHYTVLDSNGGSSDTTLTLNITGANDAAVISGATSGTVTEAGGVNNATAGTPVASGTLTDTDADNTANTFQQVTTPTLSDNHYGKFTVDASGHWSYTLDDTNATVQGLNTNGTLTDTFTVLTQDGTAQTVTVTINGADDAPVNVVPGAQAATNTTTLTFSAANGDAISVSDVDNATLTETLSVSHGTLALGGTTGLTGLSGNGTNSVTFSGSQSAINAALNGLGYAATDPYTGQDTLKIVSNDGSLSTTSTVAISVTQGDHPPVIQSHTDGSVTENLSFNVPTGDLVVNGGFEAGIPTGWTYLVNGSPTPLNSVQPVGAHSGNYDMYAYFFGSTGTSTLTQTLATVPGVTYDVQFYLSIQNAHAGTSDAFSATFGGATLVSLNNAVSGTQFGAASYTLYDYSVVATGPSTTLTFSFADSGSSYWELDDVKVQAKTTTPQGVEATSGTVTFTDADLTDLHSVSVAPNSNIGTFAASIAPGNDATGGHTGTVNWTFTVNDADLPAIPVGQSITETYTVIVDDGRGGTASQNVVITIDGDHAPHITDSTNATLTPAQPFVLGPNLITDGGFESGYNGEQSPPGWTTVPGDPLHTYNYDNVSYPGAHTGTFNMQMADYYGGPGTLTQTIATTAGTHYELDFWLDSDVGGASNSFNVLWNGQNVLALANTGTFGYTKYTVDVVGAAGSSTLTFSETNTSGFFHLDDVSLQAKQDVTSGTVSFTDVDLTDTHTVSVTPDHSGYAGAFTAAVATDATGGATGIVDWTFTVDQSVVNSLAAQTSVTQTYTVTVADNHGGTDTRDVSVTLTNPDHAPLITSDPETGSVTAGYSSTIPVNNLVSNPGFEQYINENPLFFPDVWTIGGYVNGVQDVNPGHSGAASAGFSSTSGTSLSETIATVAGLTYSVDFWLLNINILGSTPNNSTTVSVDGTSLATITNLPQYGSYPNYVWTEYTYSFVATGSSATLAFNVSDTAFLSTLNLDDVTVKVAGITPGTETAHGAITFTDVDTTDTHTVSAVADGTGYIGTFTPTLTPANDTTGGHPGEVDWTFSVPDAAIYAGVAAQTTKTQTYTVTIDDGHGGKATQDVTVSIFNPDHAPVITHADNGTINDGASHPAGTNLILNGGFEEGAIGEWSWSPYAAVILGNQPGNVDPFAHGGVGDAYQANTYTSGQTSIVETIAQTFATTPGILYTVDFWLTNESGNGPNSATVTWDGNTLAALTNLPGSFVNGSGVTYTEYEYQVLATTPTSTLEFAFKNDFSSFFLDDVSVTAASSQEATHGVISFTDADVTDTHTMTFAADQLGYVGTFAANLVTDTTGGHAGEIDWSFAVKDSDIAYLARGATLQQSYTVTINDGFGGTTTQDVVVNIVGGNHTPTPVADTVSVNEDATAAATTRVAGVLGNDTDPDSGDAAGLTVSAILAGTTGTATSLAGGTATIAGAYGSLTINADGTYSYSPNNAAAESLALGQHATDAFTYTAQDTGGLSATATLTFNITGQDDAPHVTSGAQTGSVTEDAPGAGANQIANGHFLSGLSGWLTGGNGNVQVAGSSEDGDGMEANFDQGLAGTATLTQTLATVPGATYVIDFWLANWNGSSNSFSVLWGGQPAGATLVNVPGNQIYTEHTYTVTATGPSTTLTFSGTQNSAVTGFLLDNVSVTTNANPNAPTGTITFTDPDLTDTHQVSVEQNSNLGTLTASLGTDSTGGQVGTVNWSYSVDPSAIQFLGGTDTLQQTFVVDIDDKNGGIAQQNVVITLHGTNDAPVLNTAIAVPAIIEPAISTTNIITNGGFENGTTGWTLGGTASLQTTTVHSGVDDIRAGGSTTAGTVAQNITTIAGHQYVLTFWVDATSSTNSFSVSYNGQTILPTTSISSGSYVQETVTFTGAGGSAPLQFNLKGGNSSRFIFLDDVSVTEIVPPSGQAGSLVSSLVGIGSGLANVADADQHAATGVAITGLNNIAPGGWFYSTDNGTTWLAFPTVSATNALLLAADANTRIDFVPASNNGVANFTFQAWDTTSGSNGGTADATVNGGSTAFSTASDTATVLVANPGTSPFTLTTASDVVLFSSGTNTVNGTLGTGATLNSTDVLVGGSGSDTLVLTGSGTFDFHTLAMFSGFENLVLNGTGENVTLLDNQNFTVTGGSGNTVTLGSGTVDTVTFAGGANTVFAPYAVFEASHFTGGTGTDTIAITDDATIVDSDFALAHISGIETLAIWGPSFSEVTLGAVASAEIGSGTLTIDGSNSDGNMVVDVTAMTAKFALKGTFGSTTFDMTNAQFASAPTVQGNSQFTLINIVDQAIITDAAFTNVKDVQFIDLADFANTVTLGTKAAAEANNAGSLEIDDSNASAGNALTLDATAFGSTAFLDVFGGAGNDVFKLSGTNFTSHLDIDGGAGNNTIQLTTAATNVVDTALSNIFNIQTLQLGNFVNKVTLGTNADRLSLSGVTLTIDDTAAAAGNGLTVVATALTSRDNEIILGGAGNDLIQLKNAGFGTNMTINGGAGTDTIQLTDTTAVTISDAAFTNIISVETLKIGNTSGTEIVTLGAHASADVGAGGTLTLDDSAGTANLTVNAAAMTANLTVIAGSGSVDSLTGGSGNDLFQLTKAHFDGLATPQTITGGAGNDTIQLTDTTAITIVDNDLLHVSGIETLKIGGTATNSVTLSTNASNDVGVGGTLTVDDSAGTGNLTVNGSGMTANLTVIAGSGTTDSLTGGSGNDTFQLTDAHFHGLATPQTIAGGAGSDTLWITDSASFAIGDLDLTNVSGIETLKIGGAGADTVTLGLKASADAVGVGGMLTLDDAAATGSLSLDASAMTASLKVLMSSIGNEVLTGGSGDDIFQFNSAPTTGTAQITNFNNTTQHDSFAVSAAGFAGGGLTAGQDVSATGVFESSGDNQFAASTSRFHFDTATGGLYYSGDGTTAHEVLLATVTNGSTLHANDIHVVT